VRFGTETPDHGFIAIDVAMNECDIAGSHAALRWAATTSAGGAFCLMGLNMNIIMKC
jgi:hypothetical protein